MAPTENAYFVELNEIVLSRQRGKPKKKDSSFVFVIRTMCLYHGGPVIAYSFYTMYKMGTHAKPHCNKAEKAESPHQGLQCSNPGLLAK